MPDREIKFSLQETIQKVDLKELLGRKPKPVEKEAFVQAAIERIIERSQSNKSIDGRNFRQYSKEYAEQKGVSRSDVDMTLLGDMLLSVKRQGSRSSDTVEFGIKGGVEALKSYNHNVGDTVPRRQWFGLSIKEQKQIANQIKSESFVDKTVREIKEDTQERLLRLVESISLTVEKDDKS